jgi:hypothetical protein
LVTGYVAFLHGFCVRRYFILSSDIEKTNALTMVWGLCSIFCFTSLILFFTGARFLIFIFILTAIVIHFLHRKAIARCIRNLYGAVFGSKMRIVFLLLVFALLVQSSQSSKVNDDGLYYTQTVLWLNQAGFVKGISNLFLPLGLTSSWHVLQAVFSFSFIDGIRFNDMNGFLVIVFFFYFIENYTRQDTFSTVAFSLGLLISVPFLSACSPDLPVILLTLIGFDLYRRAGAENLYDLLLLAAFGFSIKLSAVGLFLLPACLRASFVPLRLRGLKSAFALFSVIITIVLIKNTYQTGYPLYPFPWFAFTDLSWTTPVELVQFYQKGLQAWAFANIGTYEQLKTIEYVNFDKIIPLLVQREGYKGIINIIVFATAAISLLAIPVHYFRGNKLRATLRPFLALHLVSILSFIVWLKFAPQYRFIIPVVIFNISYGVYVASSFISPVPSFTYLLPGAAVIVMVILSFLTIAITISSTSRQMGRLDAFHVGQTIFPHFSYSFAGLDSLRIDKQEYYHYKTNAYCWDCPLPCLPQTYADFLRGNGYKLSKGKDEGASGFTLKR